LTSVTVGRHPGGRTVRRIIKEKLDMKFIGMLLMVLGIAALIYGGIGYNRQTTILAVGDVKATATEHKTLPIAPFVGILALLGGIGMLVVPRPRLS